MRSEKVWRATALALCVAVPVSFYVVGDVTDAFPGVLTLHHEQEEPAAGPRAQGEDYQREQPSQAVPTTAQAPSADDGKDLAERMASHASSPVVDGNLSFTVVDAESGDVIASRDADTARIPASTLKLLTASAALRVLDPASTLPTSVVADGDTLTLVGTGDMRLTKKKLASLAAKTADMLEDHHGKGKDGTKKDDGPTVRLALDTSALPGGENPAWGDNGRAGGWVAPTSALAVDEGWLDGTAYGPKSADPAGDAAKTFASLLEDEGVHVKDGIARQKAPKHPAKEDTVQVDSETIAEIAQHTLQQSDNTTAELLAHLVAREQGSAPVPKNAAAAVADQTRDLGKELGLGAEDLDALVIKDGCGLSTQDRVPPALLATVLGKVASGQAPQLEPVLYDVPVGALSGTLADRFGAKKVAAGRGVIRGKTGYLGGTAALAGVTALPDGRTVSFDIVVHGFDGEDADAARAAVDAVADEMVRS